MLLVDFREEPEAIRNTIRERGYVAPVLMDRSGDVAGRSYGVWAPPTLFFIDRHGRLVGRVVGPRGWDSPAGKEFLRALLEKKD